MDGNYATYVTYAALGRSAADCKLQTHIRQPSTVLLGILGSKSKIGKVIFQERPVMSISVAIISVPLPILAFSSANSTLLLIVADHW